MSTRFFSESSALPTPDIEPDAGDAIQPRGFALLVDHDWSVRRVSANLGQFLPVDPAACPGLPLSQILSEDAVHSLRNRVALLRQPLDVTRLFACRAGADDARFDFFIRTASGSTLIEGRPSGRAEHGDSAETVRALIRRIDAERGVEAVLAEAVMQLRAMTGYDRVACYGFTDGNSTALMAQSTRKLGAAPERLPEWFRRGTRLLIDGDGASVPLLPEDRGGMRCDAVFGAVDATRRAWLDERGAAAAMVGVIDMGSGRWGSIVCDHPTPRPVTIDRQAAFELYADMLAMKLEIATLRAGAE